MVVFGFESEVFVCLVEGDVVEVLLWCGEGFGYVYFFV